MVAWDSMHHSTKPLKYVKQRISATKLIWSMYAFQLTKMTRGHVKPSEINCTYCGDHIETQDHVFKNCSAEQITSLKQKLFESIGVQLSEYMHEGTAKWLQEHVSQIWNGNHINYPDTSYGNTLKNMNLEHVSRCAWTGITPRTLVHMIEALVMPKYRKKAARIAGHVHSLTSDTLLEIWKIRTEKLQNEVPNESKRSKYQTTDDKARILIDQGLLPGIGGTRKITWAAYMNLPKQHRYNKVQKYLKTYRKDGEPPIAIPRIGQRVRSYRLHESTSTCVKQEAVVTKYTGIPATPYAITEMNALGASEERVWPGITYKINAETLDDRLVQTDGVTSEERKILNTRVVQTFDIEQTASTKEKKHRLKKQGDTRERPTRRALTGGVTKVCGSKRGTLNTIVYEDMRTETLTTVQLLERVTFFEDPRRTQRLKELERQVHAAKAWPRSGSSRRAAQRRRRRTSSRGKGVTSLKKANRDPCGNVNTGQNSEGFLPPTGWSWTRLGLYPGAAPMTPAPRAGCPASPAGPGLPNGDATGDDD